MSKANEKAAAQAVELAKRKSVTREVAGLLTKAAEIGHRRRLTSGAISLLSKAAQGTANGMATREVGTKAEDAVRPGTPNVPPPARMKNPPVRRRKGRPAAAVPPTASGKPYMRVSAEYALLDALVKAAEATKRRRARTLAKAAAEYSRAATSGNHTRIKGAVVKLAQVMAFDAMTKQALSPELGAWLMKIMSKITPYAGRLAGKANNPWLADKAENVMQWGSRLGEQAGRVQGLLGASKAFGGEALQDIVAKNPGAVLDLARASGVGTGALAGGGGLLAGRYLFPGDEE